VANAPLILTRAEFRGWFDNFSAFVYDEGYTKLEYDKWNTLNIWSRKDSDWKEIAIEWTADGDVIWIYPRDEIRLSPNSVIVGRNDLSFGCFLWDMIMDYYDNLEISLKAVGNTAKTAAETIANSTLDWGRFSPLAYGMTDTTDTCTNMSSNNLYIDNSCLSDYIKNVVEEVNNNNKENNEMMKFDFGPVDSSVHMSMYGMAIKNASGTYVAYDKANKQIMDVDILNFEGANKFIYKMPATLAQIAAGDVIIHARKPMFVQEVREDNRLSVMDIFDGEEKVIVPSVSPFGFNFVTKVVSLFDFSNATADESNPFGNMLPFLLMSDSKSSDRDNLLPLMFMMNGNTNIAQNPMMLWALAGNRTNDPMMLAMLMGGFTANPNGSNGK
jgi:hypothetical protein